MKISRYTVTTSAYKIITVCSHAYMYIYQKLLAAWLPFHFDTWLYSIHFVASLIYQKSWTLQTRNIYSYCSYSYKQLLTYNTSVICIYVHLQKNQMVLCVLSNHTFITNTPQCLNLFDKHMLWLLHSKHTSASGQCCADRWCMNYNIAQQCSKNLNIHRRWNQWAREHMPPILISLHS